MTYFPDLSEYVYGFRPAVWASAGPPPADSDLFGWSWDIPTPELVPDLPELNVGWLDPRHSVAHGDLPSDFTELLEKKCRTERYHVTRGQMPCLFCGHTVESFGTAEIRVFAKDAAYAAPNLIWHYVSQHEYRPPAGFCDALIARAAAPMAATRRPWPMEMTRPVSIDFGWLHDEVVQAMRAQQLASSILVERIALVADTVELDAKFTDFRGAAHFRAWSIRRRAFVNPTQASTGVRTMLVNTLNELQSAALFDKRG